MTLDNAAHVAVGQPAVAARSDWRIRRLQAAMGPGWLAGEWDRDRRLISPRPGGALSRVLRCAVPGCSCDCYGASPLCARHRRQFDTSSGRDLEAWVASNEPVVVQRNYCQDRTCVVGADPTACPRPAVGRAGLCAAHWGTWVRWQDNGQPWETFLAAARPLPNPGPCVAACCYLGATHPKSRLCETHHRLWTLEGRPRRDAFDQWAARVRQPANSRVLSLRGLPDLVVAELAYAIGCRAAEQIGQAMAGMRPWIDQLRAAAVGSVIDLDPALLEGTDDRQHVRFGRFTLDRVALAYADPDREQAGDVWDLRVFGQPGRRRLDFTPIRQPWLREATKGWVAAVMGRVGQGSISHRVGSVVVLSTVLASGPGGGQDPTTLGRADVERFLARVATGGVSVSGRSLGPKARAAVIDDCGLMLREARGLGLLPTLGATFALRRGDRGPRVPEPPPGRALPAIVVAQLDANLDLLDVVAGAFNDLRLRNLGVLGERAGPMAILCYQLLKGTGRRVGEIASLHLDCLNVDEHGKDVLVYDNHKAGRMGRRLPLADSALVAAIRTQQDWVAARFPTTPPDQLWLLPRPQKNRDGTNHLGPGRIYLLMRRWVNSIPNIDARPPDADGNPVPFDRGAILPHAFRHTYAQTMADSGVAPSVLRELMDHRSLSTTLGYYQVGEQRKRAAMEILARHTIDNRGLARPLTGDPSAVATLREHLSWFAVPMGKCSEPSNVRAGGQACPIRYQCAACPHFESDPSYLPELQAYADDLRRQREDMLAANATDWAIQHVTRQLEIILAHITTHKGMLQQLPEEHRVVITDASATLRKARQTLPIITTRPTPGHG